MIKRVGGTLIGLVLVLLALVTGAMPAPAGRLAGGAPETLAFTFELLQPDPPTGLTATAASGSEVDLSWTAPGGGSPDGYNIYEATSPGGESNTDPVNANLITNTTYPVTGLTSGTTYYFEVTAVAGGNESGFSNEASAVPGQSVPPPTGLTATAASGSEVDLSWTAPGFGRGLAGFNVYEGTSPGGESNTPVNSAPIKGTTFPVTGLSGGTTYYFVVTAVDLGGSKSGSSNEASATTTPAPGPPGPPTGPAGTSALPWLVIVVLAAIGGAIAGGLRMARRRRSRSAPGPGTHATPGPGTHATPGPGPHATPGPGPHATPGPGPHATPGPGTHAAAQPSIRAVPHAGPPRVVSIHDTGIEAARTVRIEPHPGTGITTIEEAPPR